ncbi:hypothetical protein AAC387_Pa06g0384 [Persea americana]
MANSFYTFGLLFLLPALSSILYLHSPIPAFFSSARKTNVYIVYLGERKNQDPDVVTHSHYEMLAKLLQRNKEARDSMVYSYSRSFSGFAAKLTESEARQVAEFPGVLQVTPNQIHQLHTTRSWDFLGLYPPSHDNLAGKGKQGEGVIIGVMDSGIWPESKSFDDKEMGPIPTKWRGICQEGVHFNASNCNRKLIGARWFVGGQKDKDPHILDRTDEVESPLDVSGHGTHTASTAAGSLVQNVSFMGVATGVAKGGAPRAHIAVYKVCWNNLGCTTADILGAFDCAISDGVDVISASIANNPPFVASGDGYAMGTFHAVAKGIVVVFSAGNAGPVTQTVDNTAPWILTVAAGTIDRSFPTKFTLGNNATYTGQALYRWENITPFYRLAYGGSCIPGTLDPNLFAGKVVLCFWDQRGIQLADKSVAEARGAGVIFAQPPTNGLASCGSRPCIAVRYVIGTKILHYIRSESFPIVRLSSSDTSIGKVVPTISYFSSRGPSSLSPAILKPDIAAPGSDILAAWSPASSDQPGEYMIKSGTSMAGPHISGIVALLKVVHPDWGPAAIKSALVTTAANIYGGWNIEEESGVRKLANPFDYGGGYVNPNPASDPGLVYDMSGTENALFLCAMGYSSQYISAMINMTFTCPQTSSSSIMLNLNLPSITIPNLRGTIPITRTVTNVGAVDADYSLSADVPRGMSMDIFPEVLSFNATTSKLSFEVNFSVAEQQQIRGFYTFGRLTWSDGFHNVTIPISVRTTHDDDDYGDVSLEGNYNIMTEDVHLPL